jgi:hypothetical protein
VHGGFVPQDETAIAVACGNASAALRQGAGAVNGMGSALA